MSRLIERRAFLTAAAATALVTGSTRSLAQAVARTPRLPASGELRDFLTDQCQHFHIPGLSVAISAGARSETISIGKASLPFNVDVDASTLFHIGSNGKRFTAIAIQQLLQAGRLKLTDSIRTHVPESPPQWEDRTIQHLLHHVSGLPDYLADFDWTKPHTRQDVLASAARQPPLFATNAAWSYSNTNYMLLGYALENVTGISYRQYITERVLQPAHLERSQVDNSAAIIANRAEGYAFDGSFTRHAATLDGDASGWPDGGIIMSAADSLRWEQAVKRGALYDVKGASSMHVPQQLITGREVPYGCAEFIERLSAEPYYWHTGGVPGFTSFSLRVPSRDVSLLLATNVEADSSNPQRYLGQCVAEAFAPGSTPLGLAPIHDTDRKLTSAAREILFRGQALLDPSGFAPEVAQLIQGPRGQAAVVRFAPPEDFALVETRRFPGATFRRYRMSYSDRIEHVSIGYTPDRKIYWALWL